MVLDPDAKEGRPKIGFAGTEDARVRTGLFDRLREARISASAPTGTTGEVIRDGGTDEDAGRCEREEAPIEFVLATWRAQTPQVY